MIAWPPPSLRHLGRLTDDVGVVEHASGRQPRYDLEYCTDDAGRALAAATQHAADVDAPRIATVALSFLTRAHTADGCFRLRLGANRRWTDDPGSEDASGRALLGLGTAAARAPWEDVRLGALDLFGKSCRIRPRHPRAAAYAVLGAAALLEALPEHPGARQLLVEEAGILPRPARLGSWPWPERRLTYANALLPDALLAAGTMAGRVDMVEDGLALLDWLVRAETLDDRFSFTPVGGRGPEQHGPAFDQQPIEAWAMADACARAHRTSGEDRWRVAILQAGRWFLGDNDAESPMFDPETGGGFDGLERHGVNANQGAESTLAFLATMGHVHALAFVAQAAASVRRSSR